MAGRFATPNEQFLDENGDPLAGGKLAFFVTNTSTPQDTYSDDNLTVANPNPVILNGAGRAGDIFLLNADYKVTLSKADDTVVWTADPVRSTTQKSSEVRNVSSATNLGSSDDGKWIAANATAGAFVITLPEASTVGNGYEVTIQKVDASTNAVTVDGFSAETINGFADAKLEQQYQAITLRCDGTKWLSPLDEGRQFPPNYVNGFELSNGTTPATEINIGAGNARSDDDTANISLSTGVTKTTGSFAEGTNQGALDTGVIAADSAYDVYAIAKEDGTSDILFTLKGATPTLPSGFTEKARTGGFSTDDGTNVQLDTFLQVKTDGEYFRCYRDVKTGGDSDTILGLPDGPDEITFVCDDLSSDGAATDYGMQIGDSGGLVTSGYSSRCTNLTGTATGAGQMNVIAGATATAEARFVADIVPGAEDALTWIFKSNGVDRTNSNHLASGKGTLPTGPLDRVGIKSSTGGTTFDAGKFAVTAFKRART